MQDGIWFLNIHIHTPATLIPPSFSTQTLWASPASSAVLQVACETFAAHSPAAYAVPPALVLSLYAASRALLVAAWSSLPAAWFSLWCRLAAPGVWTPEEKGREEDRREEEREGGKEGGRINHTHYLFCHITIYTHLCIIIGVS